MNYNGKGPFLLAGQKVGREGQESGRKEDRLSASKTF